ncbi:MAG: gamma-butyrobetaine hydroxylase-like domain-containing protein [Acidobacteriaceae bacterium]
MSHEGIRIVPEDVARKATGQQEELSREAIDPERVRVHQSEGTGVEIVWKDGHASHWTFAWLRAACPCATCVEQREADGREPGQPKPEPKTALPIFKPAARPNKVHAVGRYAISFDWNDGHTSGIYSWHYLRSVCNCDACRSGTDPAGAATPSES